MHIEPGYPLYSSEAYSRWFYYPPPYYYLGNWYYATPWLWYDGNPHGSYTYATWQSKIVARMSKPSPVTITISGDYTPLTRTGIIYVKFRNDSTATINGRVIFIITEDSLYYAAPNLDSMHNHVARDYIPTQVGQTVSIAPGDSVTLSQSFTIQPAWNVNRCEIVTWIQNNIMQSDSTKEIWQGGMIKVTELSIEENNTKKISSAKVCATPNPCTGETKFSFNLPEGTEYSIRIFDILGRQIRILNDVSKRDNEPVKWNLRDDQGVRVSAGVYLYRIESPLINTTGKVVVR